MKILTSFNYDNQAINIPFVVVGDQEEADKRQFSFAIADDELTPTNIRYSYPYDNYEQFRSVLTNYYDKMILQLLVKPMLLKSDITEYYTIDHIDPVSLTELDAKTLKGISDAVRKSAWTDAEDDSMSIYSKVESIKKILYAYPKLYKGWWSLVGSLDPHNLFAFYNKKLSDYTQGIASAIAIQNTDNVQHKMYFVDSYPLYIYDYLALDGYSDKPIPMYDENMLVIMDTSEIGADMIYGNIDAMKLGDFVTLVEWYQSPHISEYEDTALQNVDEILLKDFVDT